MGKTDKLWGISAQRWQLYQNSKMKILIQKSITSEMKIRWIGLTALTAQRVPWKRNSVNTKRRQQKLCKLGGEWIERFKKIKNKTTLLKHSVTFRAV